MLAMLPEDKRKQWRDERQDRERTSLNRIGEAAYAMAARLMAQATATEELCTSE
jgi:hypothetical protein